MIIIKGKHAVLEAIESTIKVHSITVTTKQAPPEIRHILDRARAKNIPVSYTDKQSAMKQLKGELPQHIFAKISDIPIRPLSSLSVQKSPLVVALDHLEDPYNVGAIMRTCEGLGVNALILPKDRQAPLNSGVIKASSGAAYHLNIYQVSNIAQALIQCDKLGYWIVATDSHQGQPLQQYSPNLPTVLVMGNEHKGISQRVSKLVHDFVSIPMQGQIESLNVSVATGIILHHLTTAVQPD